MTREQKLAIVIGFVVLLLVGVLISDHLSRARSDLVEGPTESDIRSASLRTPAAPDLFTGFSPAPAPGQGPSAGQGMTGPGPFPIGPERAGAGPDRDPAPTVPDRELTSGPDSGDEFDRIADRGRQTGIVEIDNGTGDGLSLPGEALVKRDDRPGDRAPSIPGETVKPAPIPEVQTTWHTVKAGETLSKIAARHLGSAGRWRELVALNPKAVAADGTVREGVRLRVPLAAGAKPEAQGASPSPKPDSSKPPTPTTPIRPGRQRLAGDAPAPASTAATYIVKKGDSLGEISQKLLGTVKRKSEIIALNQDSLKDENSIRVGMVLRVPTK